MRISDWSSDVCSSDLLRRRRLRFPCEAQDFQRRRGQPLLGRPAGADLRRQRGQVGLVPRHHVPIQAVDHGLRTPATAFLVRQRLGRLARSEEHTSELQSLMRISYAVFCLKKKKNITI